jgi:hypothetical protein
MIIKENSKYYLEGIEEPIAWEIGESDVEIKKKENHFFLKITKWIGLVGVNEILVKYLKAEGKKNLHIWIVKNSRLGKIIVDINKLLSGEIYHNPKPPYDNQFVLPRTLFNKGSDETSKEIMKEIWEEYKPELEQRKGIFKEITKRKVEKQTKL